MGVGTIVGSAVFLSLAAINTRVFCIISGVFISQSDVGVGTIVGSAVFLSLAAINTRFLYHFRCTYLYERCWCWNYCGICRLLVIGCHKHAFSVSFQVYLSLRAMLVLELLWDLPSSCHWLP